MSVCAFDIASFAAVTPADYLLVCPLVCLRATPGRTSNHYSGQSSATVTESNLMISFRLPLPRSCDDVASYAFESLKSSGLRAPVETVPTGHTRGDAGANPLPDTQNCNTWPCCIEYISADGPCSADMTNRRACSKVVSRVNSDTLELQLV